MGQNNTESVAFSSYVNSLRRKRGVALEALCEGLCSTSMISHWESGKRIPDRYLQNRIFNRLGIDSDGFQHLLNYDKYDFYKKRLQILFHIREGHFLLANQLLDEYEASADSTNSLEKQFCLYMKATIMRCLGYDASFFHAYFEEALKLTVPNIELRPITSFVLSVQELDLILDYAASETTVHPSIFMDVISYAMKNDFDSLSQAKILPKAVVYYCKYSSLDSLTHTSIDFNQYLILLDTALESLRKTYSLYYMYEILSYRSLVIQRILSLGNSFTPNWEKQLEQNNQWLFHLSSLYEDYDVPKETFESTSLYLVKGVECLNDAIRIRRKMLKLPAATLCKDICDVKTLRRIESKSTTPQYDVVIKLLARLGLPGVYTRSDVTLDHPNTKKMLDDLRFYVNQRDTYNIDQTVHILSHKIPMNNIYNLQFIESAKVYSLRQKGLISTTEYTKKMKEILELTVPWKSILNDEAKFLSYNELAYIHNILSGLNSASQEYHSCQEILANYYKPYFETELAAVYGSQLDFICNVVQNNLGNMGDYETSNQYNNYLIKENLRLKRAGILPQFLYGIWWNNEQQERETPSLQHSDKLTLLQRCISLATLFNQRDLEEFLTQKEKALLN